MHISGKSCDSSMYMHKIAGVLDLIIKLYVSDVLYSEPHKVYV